MFNDYKGFGRTILDFFVHGTKLTYAAIGIGLVVAILYFGIFFRNSSGFGNDVSNALNNPVIDKDYDYVNRQWSKDKILLWLIISIGSGILAYYQLPEWFPHLFGHAK
ncbi:MAG TPA: hypothetical protein VGJ73_11270 [Verrucomicrobiae bacterium]|jgi:hypothetical protein